MGNLEMCISHIGNQHSINYTSNAIALFEHKGSQSAQPIELSHRNTLVTKLCSFHGEPVPILVIIYTCKVTNNSRSQQLFNLCSQYHELN